MDEINSLQLTESQLESITEMASCLMAPEEIAILLNIDIEQFKYLTTNKNIDAAFKSFHKGRLQTKLILRKMVIKLAEKGSPQAEILTDKYLRELTSE